MGKIPPTPGRVWHADGSAEDGVFEWRLKDCGCGGSYHGTCGDFLPFFIPNTTGDAKVSDQYLDALTAELKTYGVEEWSLEKGKHNKLRFTWQGKKLMHVYPSSGSDWRGVMNSLSDLRAQLGVRRVIRKSENTRERRRNATRAEAPLVITVKPDPFQCLAALTAVKQEEIRTCPRMSLAEIAKLTMNYAMP